jgi:glutamate carboxypeptidase
MIQKSELLNSLNKIQTIVDIDSQTLNIDGVIKVQDYISTSLRKLSFKINQYQLPKRAPLLVGFREGNIDLTITFICHADTALALNEDSHFRIDHKLMTISGNGVADNKSGVILGLETISALINENQNLPNIYFVSSSNEEEGSIGCHEIFKKIGQASHLILGLEPALSNGNIISSRNGNRWYNIISKGKMAHSGRMEAANLNPVHDLMQLSQQIINLGDQRNKTKINVTSIKTSTFSSNTIPAFCELKLDVRFPSIEFRNKIDELINYYIYNNEYFCANANEHIIRSVNIDDDCPPIPFKNNSEIFTNIYLRNLLGLENKDFEASHSGGAADINYFSNPDNITIDGLGPRGFNMHSRNEFTLISDVLTRRIALTNTLRFLCQKYTHIQGEENGDCKLL